MKIMSGERLLAWFLFLVWAAWLHALHSAWSSGAAAAWIPDLGLVFALVLAAHMEANDVLACALAAAFVRSAFAGEPPIATLSGMLLVMLLALAARSMVELTGAVTRALSCGVLVFVFDAWLCLVHRVRDLEPALASGVAVPSALWAATAAAFSSAMLALVLGPLFVRLPGLSPLRRRRW
jgi:hypothetical protein